MSKVFVVPDQALVDPVTIYPDTCTGCNLCIHVCPWISSYRTHGGAARPSCSTRVSARSRGAVSTCARSREPSCSIGPRPPA